MTAEAIAVESSEATTITEHEAEQVERANATGATPVVFVHGLWLLPSSWDRWAAVFEEAGLRGPHAGLAGRPRDRRGGEGAPRGVRPQDDRPGRRPLRGGHPRPRPEAGRRSATPSAGCSPRSSPAAGCAAVSVAIDPAPFRGVLPLPISALRSGLAGAPQPGEPQPRRAAHVRAVPLRLRQRGRRGRGEGALRDVRRAGLRRAALPGRDREPQPVDRGEGRQRRTPSAARC